MLALIRACSNKTNIAATHKPTKQAAVTVCPTLSRAIISPFHWHFLSFRTGYLAPKTIISCHDIAQYCQQFFSPDNPVRAFRPCFQTWRFFPMLIPIIACYLTLSVKRRRFCAYFYKLS